ncbi:hypothetical protein ABT354_18760 [Streptomyces sp. NPDC000594]|uniref:hypothetical protein n=1 Tax=Streptomyces sp. NPDC000594 TaxID=3154261 RepID=UPI00331A54C1
MSGSANLAMMHAATLAKELDKDKVTPGVLGFLVFAGLAVGVWFLMKSLNRHMGRVNFEEAPVDGADKGKKTAPGSTARGTAKDTGEQAPERGEAQAAAGPARPGKKV